MAIDVTVPADTESIRSGASRIRETKQNTIDALATLIPSGSIIDYAGTSAPTGWLLCNGSSVLRATYPDLFTAIGTVFGSVDGTHFTLPDCRGRTTIGVGTGSGLTAQALAASGGEETHTLTQAELSVNLGTASSAVTDPGHGHTVTGHDNDGSGDKRTAGALSYQAAGGVQGVAVSNTTGITVSTTIINGSGGHGHNIMQPYLALNKIIKV